MSLYPRSSFSSDEFPVILPAFIFSDEQKPLAKVIGGTAGSFLMDEGQDIIAEKEEEENELSGSLTVLRYSREIRYPLTDKFIGYRYEFIGHLNKFKTLDPEKGLVSAQAVYSRLESSQRHYCPISIGETAGSNELSVARDRRPCRNRI